MAGLQQHRPGGGEEDTPFQLSIWYRIGSSTDGKPVAYRVNTNRQVSYAEAGSLLMKFYVDAGVPDNELVSTFDKRYIGGWVAWNQEQEGAVSVVDITVVIHAWIAPGGFDFWPFGPIPIFLRKNQGSSAFSAEHIFSASKPS